MPTKPAIPTAVAAALVTAAFASAQPLNIDFGSASGGPADSYGAAGQAGHWNVIDLVTAAPQSLAGLDGVRTNVTIAGEFGDLGPAIQISDPGTMGNHEALLDDLLPGNGDVVIGFRLEGLQPGRYDVIAYGWGPGQTSPHPVLQLFDGTCVMMFEEFEGTPMIDGCMAGQWPGGLQEGVTHITGRADIDTGVLHIQYFGSFWGASGFFNGLQIAPAGGFGPPSCLCDADGDRASDVFDLLLYLDEWFAGAPAADIDADGDTDVHDLLDWLDCFFAGCA